MKSQTNSRCAGLFAKAREQLSERDLDLGGAERTVEDVTHRGAQALQRLPDQRQPPHVQIGK